MAQCLKCETARITGLPYPRTCLECIALSKAENLRFNDMNKNAADLNQFLIDRKLTLYSGSGGLIMSNHESIESGRSASVAFASKIGYQA